MGPILSSNKDYNRTLAKTLRKSIDLLKFDVTDGLQQHPLADTLSIPSLVRLSQLNKRNLASTNERSRSELNQTSTQPNLPPVIDNQTQQEQPSSETQDMLRSSSYAFQPNFLTHNRTANSDPIVISRSVINLDNHRRLNDNHLSSFRPSRSIVERNGKQFLTETKERMERRYVEVFDETIGQMRLFEVTDYIPSRTVRSIRANPQFQSQNGFSRNPLPSRFPLNNRPPMPNNRLDSAKSSSNLINFNGSNNRDIVAREFDMYHSGATLPLNNNNNSATRTASAHPRSTTQNPIDSNNSHSQTKPYNPPTIASQEVPNQYTSESNRSPAASFRPVSSTASDTSVATSPTHSINSDDDSDSEGIDQTSRSNTKQVGNNRNNTNISYGTVGGRNSPAPLDPFKKTVNTRDPYYAKRPGFNNYSEPVINNRRFQRSATSDYAPIPVVYNQSNRNQYSHRKDSNTYYD